MLFTFVFLKNMSKKRYFPPELLEKAITKFDKSIEKYEIGRSVKGLPIIELKIGNGKKIFLCGRKCMVMRQAQPEPYLN